MGKSGPNGTPGPARANPLPRLAREAANGGNGRQGHPNDGLNAQP
ncbi:hypothetical protein FAGKG844_40133 [Frankia sp. AgKG'84/4]